MKNKLKSLLALALSVLIGHAWAADPVATWTDFNTLTSGDYTLVENGNTISDGVLTIGSKPSYIAGTTTWDPRATGNAVVLAMRVTNLDLTKVSALVSLKLGEANNQLGLMTDGEGGMDAMWEGSIRGGNNAVSTKLSTAATEYLIVFKYDNSGTYAWAIGNDGVFANYTKDTGCKGGTNEAGGDIRIGALYGAGSPATGLQIHSMTLWNTNEAIEDVIAACATEEMKTNRAFVENGTGAEYTATVAEDVNLSEIVWTKNADDTTVTTANLPNGAKLKIDASNNPVITSDVVFANKLIYTANPLTVTTAITPNQNDYSAIIPGIVSNPSYEIFPAGLFVGPGAVTYTATLNAPLGYEIVVAGNRATLKTVDSATLGIPSFGVNFYNNDAAKVAGTEVQGAYPIKGAAWTDVQGSSSTAVTSFNLADAAGNITENTTMSLERTQGARQWGLNNMPSSALLKGYIDDSNGNPTTLTFSNIPYAQYRVIVYMSTDTANYTFAPVSIGGISYASTVGNSATATVASSSNWGHTGPNHDANALAEGVNYLVSSMMTDSSCVISAVRTNGGPRATIAAVQFIDCTAENRTMTLPGQEITLDANTNISDIVLTATEVLITVKPGVTLTFDQAVTLDFLRVVAEGTAENPVKFDATVPAPFANIGSVSLEGTAVEVVADIYVDAKPSKTALEVIAIASNAAATADTPQEVASTIAIASGKTLKTKGYLNFSAANTIAGTLEVVSGVTTFNLAERGLNGTLKVAAGATFKNGTNDGPDWGGAPTFDIAGTLEVTGTARWSLSANTTTTLREGAVLKGAGGSGYNYAFDWFDGATINVLGDATIEGNIGGHNPGAILTFNVAEGKTLTIAGKFDGGTYSGNSSLAVSGAGTLKLTNVDNNYRGTTTINASATLELEGGSLGTGAVTVADGATIAGSGTIGGTLTLVAGSTVDATDGSLTVNGDVTLPGEGDVTVKVAETAEAGDTVITCANAEAVAAALTGAPEGLRYVAENGAVKLAVAKVTVTLPAVSNAVWKDAEGNIITSITVDPNSSTSVKLETTGDYVFADGTTSMNVTIESGDADSEATAPADASIVAAKAKIGTVLYATFDAAFAAANEDDTITLLAPVTITSDTTIDLAGKNITSDGDVFIVESGTLTINGEGVITANTDNAGTACALWANGGNAVINGGTWSCGGDTETNDVTHQNDAIYTKNGGRVTITGGTFEYTENVWTLNENDQNRGTISVTGGSFKTFNPADNTSEGAGTNFCAEGYEATEGEDGYWTVVEAKAAVARIGDTEYETLQLAFEAVKDNETIVLLKDVTDNVELPSGKTAILDLNGQTINGYITVTGNSDVTTKWLLQNGTVINTSTSTAAISASSATIELTQIDLTSYYHCVRLNANGVGIVNSGTYVINRGGGRHILYLSGANTSLTVNGGSFRRGTGDGETYCVHADCSLGANKKVTLKGGMYYKADGHVILYIKNGAECSITGGNYQTNPSSYLASGYLADTTINSGYYTVAKAYNVAKTIDTTKVTITGLNDAYACGGKASFTIAAIEGNTVTGVTLDGEALTADENGNYTFTMPEKDVAIVVTTESTSTFDVMINGQPVADADALKLAANSTTTMTVPETSTWTAEGNVLKKDGEAYVTFADYYTVVVNGTSVTLKLNKPVIGESTEGADDAFTVTADAVTIKITNYNSALKYGVRIAADINGLGSAAITPVEPNDGVITLEKSGDSAFYEVVVSDVDFPATPAE